MKDVMKKLEIIVKGNQLQAIQELRDRTEVSGYTIIPNISGKGHHGLHQGQLMFNELDTLDMVITVVPEDKGDQSCSIGVFGRGKGQIPRSVYLRLLREQAVVIIGGRERQSLV